MVRERVVTHCSLGVAYRAVPAGLSCIGSINSDLCECFKAVLVTVATPQRTTMHNLAAASTYTGYSIHLDSWTRA